MPEPPRQSDPNAPRLDCPSCGYNVGPTSDWSPGSLSVCPECGENFDAEHLAKQHVPEYISSGEVIWHVFWPALLVFFASIVPMLSLFMMPVAVLLLLIINASTSSAIAKRIAYHGINSPNAWQRDKFAGIGILLWLAQAAIMAFAAFGGCAIAVSSLQFH